MTLMVDIKNLFQKTGLSSETTTAFRFGQGVMGKSTIAMVAFIGMVSICAYKLNSEILIFSVFIICAVLFAIYIVGNFFFAHKNPLASILEGADYVAVKKIEATAQGVSLTPSNDQLVETEEPLQLGGPQ